MRCQWGSPKSGRNDLLFKQHFLFWGHLVYNLCVRQMIGLDGCPGYRAFYSMLESVAWANPANPHVP